VGGKTKIAHGIWEKKVACGPRRGTKMERHKRTVKLLAFGCKLPPKVNSVYLKSLLSFVYTAFKNHNIYVKIKSAYETFI
jgi:hypothetical protein